MVFQIRLTLVIDKYSPLLAPLMTEESTPKTVSQPPKPTEDKASDSETPVQQVTPLLDTTPRENSQLQHRNSPDDFSNVLGTCVYQGYVETTVANSRSYYCQSTQKIFAISGRSQTSR